MLYGIFFFFHFNCGPVVSCIFNDKSAAAAVAAVISLI